MWGDDQEPAPRGGTLGTSGHVPVKSCRRGGVCVIPPASTPRTCWVWRRAGCMASRSKVWRKSRGTAGQPGGNRDNTPPPAATTRT